MMGLQSGEHLLQSTWELHCSSFMDANAIPDNTQAAVLEDPTASHHLQSSSQPEACQLWT